MSLVRLGGQLVDDERHCVACPALAPAERYQTVLPGKVDELRAKARAYARLADENAAEADAIQTEIESAQPHAYLCGAYKAQLPPEMRGPWSPVGAWSVGMPMGGRLSDAPRLTGRDRQHRPNADRPDPRRSTPVSPSTPKARDRRYRTSLGAAVDLTAEVETPVEPYPLPRGGRAVPDRTRLPDIGAACHDTRKVAPAPAFTDELRSGVETRTSRGNNAAMPKTTQEYGDSVREARGVRTRPERPGGTADELTGDDLPARSTRRPTATFPEVH